MKSRFLPLLLAGVTTIVTVAGPAPIAHAQENSGSLSLTEFRVALDQIGRGNFETARILLESSSQKGAIASENALLLAYLQEKAGDKDKARTTLQRIRDRSPLQDAYFARLGGVGQSEPVVLTGGAKPTVAAARLGSTDSKINQLEKFMLTQVNAERTKKGLRALVWNDDVAAIARAHSAEMRDKNYFAHESPVKSLEAPIDRYRAAQGNSPRLIAENVYRAWGDGSFLTEKAILTSHESLMKSPGHRSNILLSDVTQGGIGIVANKEGHIWVTQVFVRP